MFQQSSFYSANRVRMSIGPLTLTPFRTRPVASGMSTSNPARIKASLIWRAKEKSSPVIDIVSIPTLRCDLPNSRQASAISSTSFSLNRIGDIAASSCILASRSCSAFWFASAARALASAVPLRSCAISDWCAFSTIFSRGASNLSPNNSPAIPITTNTPAQNFPDLIQGNQYRADASSPFPTSTLSDTTTVSMLAGLWILLRNRRRR